MFTYLLDGILSYVSQDYHMLSKCVVACTFNNLCLNVLIYFTFAITLPINIRLWWYSP